MRYGGRARLVIGCFAAACALAPPALAAPPQPAFTKSTYRVPVTQPDELGLPVSLDTDVYLPERRPPRRGFPLVMLFHGGGSDKLNGFDVAHAETLAKHGYGVILYSARGHGDSDGQTVIAGPKEIRDLFDVAAWALGLGGRDQPAHPDFHLDRRRLALGGYSQGGLHANLGEVWSRDPTLDPYGLHPKALIPGNTPDFVFEALVQNSAVKLSYGVGLLETYLVGAQAQVSPLVGKWIGAVAADQPAGYGSGGLCDHAVHDTLASSMKSDLAVRSVGCFPETMTAPSAWAQAFDDFLFLPDMAIHMWRTMPNPDNRLYLSMGGHAAPSAAPEVEQDKLRWQVRFLNHELRGRPLREPNVVYWSRKPKVKVPADAYVYPLSAWRRHEAPTWPPPHTRRRSFSLSSDGRIRRRNATAGTEPLAPLAENAASDPVAKAALSATPLGTSPVELVPPTDSPGAIAAFHTKVFRHPRQLDGAVAARVGWTPLSADSQLVIQVLDRGPDGTATLIGRGVEGLRGASPGVEQRVRLRANQFSARIAKGHQLLVWLAAADANFYKPYPGSLGGVLAVGPSAKATIPMRQP